MAAGSQAIEAPDVVDPPECPVSAPRPRRRAVERWFVGSVVATVAFHVVFVARTGFRVDGTRYFSLFDDAMISMRYARNLADGHGLAWNAEGPAVEGITNPLWTVWMAVLHLLPVPDSKMALTVAATSSTLIVGTLFLVRHLARRLSPDVPAVAVAAVVLTATYYPLAFWSLRGMEVALLAFLLTGAIALAIRAPDLTTRDLGLLAAALAAAVLTRTDAVVPASLIAAWVVARTPGRRRRTALALPLTLAATLLVLTLARLAYYGDPLPNTYYLKVTGIPLETRVRTGWTAFRAMFVVHLMPLTVLAALALAPVRRRLDPAVTLLLGVVAGQVAYSVAVGGDAWEYLSYANRYVTTVSPALCLLAAVGLGRLVSQPPRRSAALFGVVLAGSAAALFVIRQWGDFGIRSFVYAGIPGIDRHRDWLLAAAALLLLASAGVLVTVATERGEGPAADRLGGVLVRHRRAVVLTGCLLAAVATNQQAVRTWFHHGAGHVADDNEMAAAGVRVGAATTEDAVVAVYWAGNSPYFSHRPAVDLLGKSDRVVARVAQATESFRPGHDKTSYDHSLGGLQPDLVELGVVAFGSDAPRPELERYGYERVGRQYLVRTDSDRVDRRRLARGR